MYMYIGSSLTSYNLKYPVYSTYILPHGYMAGYLCSGTMCLTSHIFSGNLPPSSIPGFVLLLDVPPLFPV